MQLKNVYVATNEITFYFDNYQNTLASHIYDSSTFIIPE